MSMKAIEALSTFSAGLQYDDLPAEVVEQAKRFLLDAVGCAYAAYKEDPKKAVIATKNRCRVWARVGACHQWWSHSPDCCGTG